MEIKNNKEEVPFQHYLQEFQRMDPEDAVRRLEIPFDGKAFALDFLNETYTITWPESIQGAQASVILKFSKSKNRPSWHGMNSTGRPA